VLEHRAAKLIVELGGTQPLFGGLAKVASVEQEIALVPGEDPDRPGSNLGEAPADDPLSLEKAEPLILG
jgi:hypothetical protein